MITDYNRLSGLHKVAILFSVLGESLAMSLIKGLSRTEVRKIRATIREMDSVSFTLKRRIMEEFYFGFLSEQFSEEGGYNEDEGPIKPFELTYEDIQPILGNTGKLGRISLEFEINKNGEVENRIIDDKGLYMARFLSRLSPKY